MTTAIEGSDATVSDSSLSVSLRLKSVIVRGLMLCLSERVRPKKLIHLIRRHFDRSGEIL